MLTVTDAAAERLAQKLDGIRAAANVAVRLVAEGDNGVLLQPGEHKPGDTAFEHDGRVVLVVDEQTAAAISGYVLDVSSEDPGISLLPRQ